MTNLGWFRDGGMQYSIYHCIFEGGTAAMGRRMYKRTSDRIETERAVRESEARLAADLAGMRRLYELHARIATETDLKTALNEILATACEFTGTDRGCVQLMSGSGEHLEMFAWRGYREDSPFIRHFRHEGLSQIYDFAGAGRRRLIIEDTVTFPGLARTARGRAIFAEGIRAAQYTPMISRKGQTVGVLSTQFRQPHCPSADQLRLIDLLAWTAADFVERHHAEAALRASEERQALLLEISDTLRALTDPIEIQTEACRILRRRLNVSRVVCAEITNDNECFIHSEAALGVRSISGRLSLSEFGEELLAQHRRGEALAVNDSETDPRVTEPGRRLFRSIGTRANCSAALLKSGRWVAALAAHSNAPRVWTAADVTLVRETAERTWSALERARAETALREAQTLMRNSLTEKEELLKEVHHRVKNNLQVITSLFSLQARQIEDKKTLAQFEEARNRVQSIASIHEMLYRSASFSSIQLGAYARGLANDVISFYGVQERIHLEVEADESALELQRAVPFALLLNELVSNVCKHAFPAGRCGSLSIQIGGDQQQIRMRVGDNGIGLLPDFDYSSASSLGIYLVHRLARQLEATLDFRSNYGTTVEVLLPRSVRTAEDGQL